MTPNKPNGWAVKLLCGSIATVTIALFSFIGTNVVANDKSSRQRDEKIEKASILRDDILKDCIGDMKAEILQRLTRIETKIETRNDVR